MAAAVAAVFDISDRMSPDIGTVEAGWVGSKAGSRNHIVTIDSSGRLDQAAAAGAVITPPAAGLGILVNDIASTVAVDSEEALDVQFRRPTDSMRLELALITSGTSFTTLVAPTATRVGEIIGLARRTEGEYVADTTGTDLFKVTKVNVTRGTVKGYILHTYRIGN